MSNIDPLDQPFLARQKKSKVIIWIVIITGLVLAGGIAFYFMRVIPPAPVEVPPDSIREKPIIYLYPEEKIIVNVQLDYAGDLMTTYPKYNPQKGWTVEASPDGTLLDPSTQKEYYGLYWEGNDSYQYDLSTGFVVKGAEAAMFLDEKLAELGLNRREANEFIVYWLPQLEQNKYNLIHFAQKDYQNLAKLNISPKPTTLIRVFMVFQALEQPIDIVEQKLPSVERKGFTVVEWGGTEQPKKQYNDY